MKLKSFAFILLVVFMSSLTGVSYTNGIEGQSSQTVPAIAELTAEDNRTTDYVKPALKPDIPAAVQPETTKGETDEVVVEEAPRKLEFIAVGDVMLGRNVGRRLEQNSEGYLYAFKDVVDIFKKGDIIFANLEAPITSSTHGLNPEKKIVLKCKPEAFEAIKSAGFNLISLSNNHMLDYYDKGLFDTMDILDKNGIAHAGAGKNLDEARRPVIMEKNGVRIGLLAYTDMAEYTYAGNPSISYAAGSEKAGLVPRKLETIEEDIARLRSSVDILAVSLHWGVEESFTVTPGQVEFARKLLDDGADMILGHHPHQFQGIEVYKGKPIFYSMGNFLFDQNDPENMESFILNMTYSEKVLTALSAIPVRIVDKNHVVPQVGKDAQNILSREISLSEKLGTVSRVENDKLIFDLK